MSDDTRPRSTSAIIRGGVILAISVVLAVVGVPLFLVGAVIALGVVIVTSTIAVAVVDAWPDPAGDPDRLAAPRPRRHRRSDREGPADLMRAERAIAVASTEGGVHFHLRPLLIELTASLPTGAVPPGSRLAGAIQPDKAPPEDRLAPGLSLDDIRGIVDELEAAWSRR